MECNICHKTKSVKNFQPAKKGRKDTDGKTYDGRCKQCKSKIMKTINAKPNVKAKKSNQHIIRKYGITAKEKEEMWWDQQGICLICHEKMPDLQSACIDHDHKTDKIRGLLHFKCNALLGLAGENELTLQRAIDYLSRFSKK